MVCFENKTKRDPFFCHQTAIWQVTVFKTISKQIYKSISIFKPHDSQNNFDNTALFHPPPSALFLLLCFSLICQSLGKTWSALFSKGSQETFPPNNSEIKIPPNFSEEKHPQNNLKNIKIKRHLPKKLWRTISTRRTLKTSPQESEKKNVYQTNLWKTCSTKNPWEKTSTKIASEKQICTQEISTQKKLKEHLQRISVQKPSLKKRDIPHPKKSRWISITKKKSAPKKYLNRKLSTRKTLKNPYQKLSEEKSLPKIFQRDISTKVIYLKINLFQKESRESPTKKSQMFFFRQKSYAKKSLQFSFKRNLYETKLKIYLYVKTVKRNLYQKMFENAFLPKSLRRHLQQRIWEEKSKGTNLSRKKVTKSLKRNLYQNNPPDPSRDISKISLKRHFYQTSIWEVFFFGILYRTKEPHRGFSTKLYSRKKRLPKNSSEIVTAKKIEDGSLLKKSFQKKLWRKVSTTNLWIQKFEYKNQPNKNVWTKKHEKESLQDKNIWTEIIYPKKPEDKSLPKNTLKRNLYETVSQDKFTQKKLCRLYQKTLSTKEIQRNSLPKSWKIYPIQFLPKRSLPKKIKRPWIWFLKMIYPIKVSSKFRWNFDSASRSFIETSIRPVEVSSKLRWNFDSTSRSFDETSILPVKVSMKLRFDQSKFHRSFDSKIEVS